MGVTLRGISVLAWTLRAGGLRIRVWDIHVNSSDFINFEFMG